jgi:[ribosomal protein S5]-alanine N-acetyltransferase
MVAEFLIGKRIFLRGLREEDITASAPYFGWLNDLSLDAFTERSYFPNTPARMRSYFDSAMQYRDPIVLAICDVVSGKHIGNIAFNEVNPVNRRAFIAYLLGDKSFTGRGIVTDAVLMFMYYGFNKLNFERIHGGVSDAHQASKKVCEKVGLLVEGRLRHHLLRNGTWHDMLPVGALRSEWMRSHGQRALECFAEPPT